MFTHRNQAGSERHHRLAAKIGTDRVVFQRRYAIQNQPRTRPVEVRLRPQQNTTRRGDRTLTRFTCAKAIEDIELLFGRAALRLVRARKVADDIDRLAHVFTLRQALIKRLGLLRTHAQAVHSRVELHPDGDRFSQYRGFQSFKLLLVVDGSMQTLRGDSRQIGSIKKSFQQQDGLRDPSRSQPQGFFKTSDTKSVRIGERSRGL